MKKFHLNHAALLATMLFVIFLMACATGPSATEISTATTPATTGLTLLDAIEQAAAQIAAELPAGSRVAVLDFQASSEGLSAFIRDEFTAALIDKGIEVAARHSLEYVQTELDLSLSGNVSDESALSIGKWVAIELLVTGQLTYLGNAYRFSATATRVQEAIHISAPRFNVIDDRAMRDIISSLGTQPVVTAVPHEGEAPQSAGTFLDRGILLAMRGDYETAIADFDEAIRLSPDMFSAYMLRGRALIASVSTVSGVGENFSGMNVVTTEGQTASVEQVRILDKAIADYTQAIRLDPNNTSAYIHRGYVYYAKGDYNRAIADYDQAIKLAPYSKAAYNNRGHVLADKGDLDAAIADYDQALRLDPNFTEAYKNRGNAYYFKNDYDRAIADYNQMLRLDPNDAGTYSIRGAIYFNKNDFDRAIADYTQAIRIYPNHATYYYNRGASYHMKGDIDRAITDYTQAIRLDPNNATAYRNRGAAYNTKNDFDRAIADFAQAIRLNPNDAEAYGNRGNVYGRKGDIDAAIADYTQSIRLNPNDATTYRNRGVSYTIQGDIDHAIADLEAALCINPNDATARDVLEIARLMRGL